MRLADVTMDTLVRLRRAAASAANAVVSSGSSGNTTVGPDGGTQEEPKTRIDDLKEKFMDEFKKCKAYLYLFLTNRVKHLLTGAWSPGLRVL